MKTSSTILIITLFLTFSSHAQDGIGIGTLSPDSSAILDIVSINKGVLPPRLSNTNMLSISDPADGLIVYNTSAQALYCYTNDGWSQVGSPRGSIVMWSGNISSLPFGWALCDGRWYNPNNNTDRGTTSTPSRNIKTPDLRGKFIAGYDPEYSEPNNEYDNPGNFSTGGTTAGDTGGADTVTLTTAQIPSHSHTTAGAGGHSHTVTIQNAGTHDHSTRISRKYSRNPDDVNGPGLVYTTGPDEGVDMVDYETSYNRANIEEDGNHSHTASANSVANHTHTINPTGGGKTHENRPAYYVLAFIMKL